MREQLKQHYHILVIWLLSLPVKFLAAQNTPWDIDFVPVVSRNVEYFLTPVGTLSSVAAYNLPMLEWIHLPAQWLTGNVWWTIILTLMVFNLLGTLAMYTLGFKMFSRRVALIGATWFTFSELGVSSFYTAWAQLLLPSFFAMVMMCLWLWYQQKKGWWLALAGILATSAFMIHFSALLLFPAMLVFALVTRAEWQWGWLATGAVGVIVLLLPYTLVQIERDFVDVRAFATQEVLVDDATMDEARIYQFGVPDPTLDTDTEKRPAIQQDTPAESTQNTTDIVRPRWLRAIDYALEAPDWYGKAMTTGFVTYLRGIHGVSPLLAQTMKRVLESAIVVYWVAIVVACWRFVQSWRGENTFTQALTGTPAGRVLLLVLFNSVVIVLMLLTRTIENRTYWMGLVSMQYLIFAYGASLLPNSKTVTAILIGITLVYSGTQTVERTLRITQHDDSVFSPYNVSLYRHVANTVNFIAEDWQSENDSEQLIVSYDILRDMPNLWWVVGWHSIDPSYRMGMNFDFLLSYHHGLENTNTDPVGIVDNADYIVVYSPSLSRYNLEDYTVEQFGAIIVLIPLSGN